MEMILTFALWFVLIMLGIHVGYALIMASVFFFVVSDGWSLLPFALEQLSASSSSRSSFSQDLQAGCHVLPHWTVVLRNVPGFSPQNTHTFSFSICHSPLCSLKSKVTGTLEGHISMISFDQHTILTSGHVQFHSVTAFYLKCHIVSGGSAGMMHSGACVIMVMMVGHIGPLRHDGCRHSQSGRMVILIPLADTFHCNHDKHTDNYNKYEGYKNAHDIETGTETGKAEIIEPKSHTHFLSSMMQSEALHCCKASPRNLFGHSVIVLNHRCFCSAGHLGNDYYRGLTISCQLATKSAHQQTLQINTHTGRDGFSTLRRMPRWVKFR